MKWNMLVPCSNCPFKRSGIKLHPDRALEISDGMLSSQVIQFPCHKTVTSDQHEDADSDGNVVLTERNVHCAGALIFAEKNETATQMMRISERCGMYNPAKLMDVSNQSAIDSIFDDQSEMIEANEEYWDRKS